MAQDDNLWAKNQAAIGAARLFVLEAKGPRREREFAFHCSTWNNYACAGRSPGATFGWPGAGFSTCCTSSLAGGGSSD